MHFPRHPKLRRADTPVAGAVSPDPSSFNNGDNVASGGRPFINGNREQANNFLLDGMDNNQVSDNLLGYTPSPDAIQEFNSITNNAPRSLETTWAASSARASSRAPTAFTAMSGVLPQRQTQC